MIGRENSNEEKILSEGLKELIVTRIEAQMSPNLRLSIGGGGSLGTEEMIEHVNKGDQIGRQIIESHMRFIKAQASGALIMALNSVE